MKGKKRYTVKFIKDENNFKNSYYSIWKDRKAYGRITLYGKMLEPKENKIMDIPKWELRKIKYIIINSSSNKAILIAWTYS